MKDGTKNIIAACILAIGIIISAIIYTNSNRYVYDSPFIIDKITGDVRIQKDPRSIK